MRLLVLLLSVILLADARAEEAVPDVAAGLRDQPQLAQVWLDARSLERAGFKLEGEDPEQAVQLYQGAAQLFERVAADEPNLSAAYWRSARSYWMAGETLPPEAKEQKGNYFERAEGLANGGIEVDPECAECMLWKFIAMGRLRTTRGLWIGVRQLPHMAELLDRGIALEPTYTDGEDNSTLGNLHYSSAIFYRLFPDWFWVGWVLGVKGDKERALEHSQVALELHPMRLDYQIELATQLLCLGRVRKDGERQREGEEVMRVALTREAQTQDEERELAAARYMLENPDRACAYAGDSFIEVDPKDARKAAKAID